MRGRKWQSIPIFMEEEWTHRAEQLPRDACGRDGAWSQGSGSLFCMKPHRLSITQGKHKTNKHKTKSVYFHLLELGKEEREGREQMLIACPVDVTGCG